MSFFADQGSGDRAAIEATVRRYIDGYLGQEAPTLRQAFHPDAKLMAIDAGEVSQTATAAWFDRIEAKRQGGGGPLTASHEILGIDQARDAAVAKVRLDFGTYEFTDYLSLLRAGGGWQIVNKIYEAHDKG